MNEALNMRDEQKQAYDSHEDTSMKKCTKYYEYVDKEDRANRRKGDIAMCNRSNYSEYVRDVMQAKPLKKTNKNLTQNVYGCAKSKRDLSISCLDDKKKKSVSLTMCSGMSKPNSSRDELRYYKKVCAQIRKRNEYLEQQMKMKTVENKENLRSLENKLKSIGSHVDSQVENIAQQKYKDLLDAVNGLTEKLNKKELKNEKYKKFFVSIVESLELLGYQTKKAQILDTKDVWKAWKQIIHFLIEHKYVIKANQPIR